MDSDGNRLVPPAQTSPGRVMTSVNDFGCWEIYRMSIPEQWDFQKQKNSLMNTNCYLPKNLGHIYHQINWKTYQTGIWQPHNLTTIQSPFDSLKTVSVKTYQICFDERDREFYCEIGTSFIDKFQKNSDDLVNRAYCAESLCYISQPTDNGPVKSKPWWLSSGLSTMKPPYYKAEEAIRAPLKGRGVIYLIYAFQCHIYEVFKQMCVEAAPKYPNTQWY